MDKSERYQILESWVKGQFPARQFSILPVSIDASFRQYFRITFNDKFTPKTLIIMDAPPQHEDCVSFLHVADIFSIANVNVPKILGRDFKQGFLLLSDFGNTTYMEALHEGYSVADGLYHDAIDSLIRIQLASCSGKLPNYDHTLLFNELSLFPTWYLEKHLHIELNKKQRRNLSACFAEILKNNLAQPKVYVHRDFHSRNLMVTDPNPGIIDFQDAVYGPITYDLVSIFKDAYVYWEEEKILDWVIRYWEQARKRGIPVVNNFSDFYRDFEWMGVQRHLKILGIFARLCYRDGKKNYLKDIPIVINHLKKTCDRYRELNFLSELLSELESKESKEKIRD
tara:strand:+ start:3043 stop:4062 length:1020 start_codon:yes stop_codon:yes gene_type:complete